MRPPRRCPPRIAWVERARLECRGHVTRLGRDVLRQQDAAVRLRLGAREADSAGAVRLDCATEAGSAARVRGRI